MKRTVGPARLRSPAFLLTKLRTNEAASIEAALPAMHLPWVGFKIHAAVGKDPGVDIRERPGYGSADGEAVAVGRPSAIFEAADAKSSQVQSGVGSATSSA